MSGTKAEGKIAQYFEFGQCKENGLARVLCTFDTKMGRSMELNKIKSLPSGVFNATSALTFL